MSGKGVATVIMTSEAAALGSAMLYSNANGLEFG